MGAGVTSASYLNRSPSMPWSKEETEAFLSALRKYGTDFTLIAALFPNRDRRQIKNKFKREEKLDAGKIDRLLASNGRPDPEQMQAVINGQAPRPMAPDADCSSALAPASAPAASAAAGAPAAPLAMSVPAAPSPLVPAVELLARAPVPAERPQPTAAPTSTSARQPTPAATQGAARSTSAACLRDDRAASNASTTSATALVAPVGGTRPLQPRPVPPHTAPSQPTARPPASTGSRQPQSVPSLTASSASHTVARPPAPAPAPALTTSRAAAPVEPQRRTASTPSAPAEPPRRMLSSLVMMRKPRDEEEEAPAAESFSFPTEPEEWESHEGPGDDAHSDED